MQSGSKDSYRVPKTAANFTMDSRKGVLKSQLKGFNAFIPELNKNKEIYVSMVGRKKVRDPVTREKLDEVDCHYIDTHDNHCVFRCRFSHAPNVRLPHSLFPIDKFKNTVPIYYGILEKGNSPYWVGYGDGDLILNKANEEKKEKTEKKQKKRREELKEKSEKKQKKDVKDFATLLFAGA